MSPRAEALVDLGTGGNALPLLLVKQFHSFLEKGSTFTVPESLQICLHVMWDSLSLCAYVWNFD